MTTADGKISFLDPAAGDRVEHDRASRATGRGGHGVLRPTAVCSGSSREPSRRPSPKPRRPQGRANRAPRAADGGEPTGISIPIGDHAAPVTLAFTPEGTLAVSTWDPPSTTLWDPATGQQQDSYPVGGAFALSRDGKTAAIGDLDGAVTRLDLATGDTRRFGVGHEAKILGASFSPDGKTLFTGGDDAKVVVWDVETGQIREILSGHSGRVFAPAVTSDGATIYTPSQDGTVIVWDVAGNRRLGRPFAFSPEERPILRPGVQRRRSDSSRSEPAIASRSGIGDPHPDRRHGDVAEGHDHRLGRLQP